MSNSSSKWDPGTQVMIFTGLGDHTWQMTRLPSQQLAKAGVFFFFFRLNVAWSTVFKNFYSLFGWRFFTGFYHGRSLLNHQLGNISLIFSHHLTVSKSKKTQQFVDFDVFYRSLLFGGHLNGGTAIGWFGDVDELGGCTLFQDVSLVGKNHIIRLDQPIA